jgi:two-component system, chemotaxis family, chemotaxis protein CheY
MKTLTVETNQLMVRLSKPLGLSSLQYVDEHIIQDIIFEWSESLARLENMALRIETEQDDSSALDEIKRTLHTIKGDLAVCGLSEVSDVIHQAEDLLESFIEEGACPTDMLLRIKDWLQQILKAIASGEVQLEIPASSYKDLGKNCSEPVPSQERSRADASSLKTLIVEDDFTNRLLLQELLKVYGTSHIAVNGKEAVDAVRIALEADEPYDLICLDIMMPEMDGQTALKEIRAMEEAKGILSSNGAKIVMTTALSDIKNLTFAFGSLCDAYLVKPIDKSRLMEELRKLELIT